MKYYIFLMTKPGGGNGFLFSSLHIFPLHPLHHDTLPNTKTSQNGVSTGGRGCACWLTGGDKCGDADREL